MWNGLTVKANFSDLCLNLSHGPSLYVYSILSLELPL